MASDDATTPDGRSLVSARKCEACGCVVPVRETDPPSGFVDWNSQDVPALLATIRTMESALVAIIDQSLDEPGGLNFANRARVLARDALGWEKQ